MMKTRTQLYIAIALLTLGMSWYIFSKRNQAPMQIFPATINRDCAPWDGSAFTVSIPMNDGTMIDISIWKAPDIKFPVTFSFPDNTGQVGNASYRLTSDKYEQLSGKVFFQRVGEGNPVEGRFEFVTETGRQFNVQFKAEWGNLVMMCG
jgi:hypothetical protein